jgi:hypothetical protein
MLLKEGNFREAEALEQTHRDQQDWHFDKMTGGMCFSFHISKKKMINYVDFVQP